MNGSSCRNSIVSACSADQSGAPAPVESLGALHPRRAFAELKAIALGKSIGELLLVRDQQDAAELAAEVVQLVDHGAAVVAVEAAEALIDDDRLDRPVLPAGVLANPERQPDRHAEALAAAEER